MMNWEALGAIGEIVGAVAVLATLWILLLQVRQNTRALEANSDASHRAQLDRNFSDLSRWRDLLARDAELTDIWLRGCAGQDLSDGEAERFVAVLNEMIFGFWRGFEAAVSLGDDAYRDEILMISASFGAYPVIRKRFAQMAGDTVFERYVGAVVPLIEDADIGMASGVAVYRELTSR